MYYIYYKYPRWRNRFLYFPQLLFALPSRPSMPRENPPHCLFSRRISTTRALPVFALFAFALLLRNYFFFYIFARVSTCMHSVTSSGLKESSQPPQPFSPAFVLFLFALPLLLSSRVSTRRTYLLISPHSADNDSFLRAAISTITIIT